MDGQKKLSRRAMELARGNLWHARPHDHLAPKTWDHIPQAVTPPNTGRK